MTSFRRTLTYVLARLFCRPFGPRCLFLRIPGAARYALAPGYLMAAPSALPSRTVAGRAFGATFAHRGWPRLRRYLRAPWLAAPSALPSRTVAGRAFGATFAHRGWPRLRRYPDLLSFL